MSIVMKIIWRIKDTETMLCHAWPAVQPCLNTSRGRPRDAVVLEIKVCSLCVCKLSSVLVTGLLEGQGGGGRCEGRDGRLRRKV